VTMDNLMYYASSPGGMLFDREIAKSEKVAIVDRLVREGLLETRTFTPLPRVCEHGTGAPDTCGHCNWLGGNLPAAACTTIHLTELGRGVWLAGTGR
jgi:hypothetical protein